MARARIFVLGHYLFLKASQNRWCPRTNIRTYFHVKWRLSFLYAWVTCLLSVFIQAFTTREDCITILYQATQSMLHTRGAWWKGWMQHRRMYNGFFCILIGCIFFGMVYLSTKLRCVTYTVLVNEYTLTRVVTFNSLLETPKTLQFFFSFKRTSDKEHTSLFSELCRCLFGKKVIALR